MCVLDGIENHMVTVIVSCYVRFYWTYEIIQGLLNKERFGIKGFSHKPLMSQGDVTLDCNQTYLKIADMVQYFGKLLVPSLLQRGNTWAKASLPLINLIRLMNWVKLNTIKFSETWLSDHFYINITSLYWTLADRISNFLQYFNLIMRPCKY